MEVDIFTILAGCKKLGLKSLRHRVQATAFMINAIAHAPSRLRLRRVQSRCIISSLADFAGSRILRRNQKLDDVY